MIIRFGYVALALNLDKVTSSSTLTFARYKKILSEEKRLNELKRVTLSNTEALYKILEYNQERDIHFYRVTSKLIPLATHPEVMWDWEKYFTMDLRYIGKKIIESSMRVDSHPDQFNVINSTKDEVVRKTGINLLHHAELFESMGLEPMDSRMVIHVGSSQGGKKVALDRFITNFMKLDPSVRKRLMLENDDKVFNVSDVCYISENLGIPIVLDIHHHRCNPSEKPLEMYLPQIFESWRQEKWPAKIHLSSPREGEKDLRKHSDFIDTHDFENLIHCIKPYNQDCDIMLECKRKDQALFKLVEDIKNCHPEWEWIDATTLKI
ncbi:UV DNA damage repair endonuclease UvsE [Vallitalea okinawensis]|uniref:UV DNA damage repair endonuclease UvsE n=1 Tax=Vallitalea okinawensis TaxID=2078660 RepID=UPI000CFDE1E8|nr:UV DNA damage repair endonuclease UvsE [Vallitalea okinawensis]